MFRHALVLRAQSMPGNLLIGSYSKRTRIIAGKELTLKVLGLETESTVVRSPERERTAVDLELFSPALWKYRLAGT